MSFGPDVDTDEQGRDLFENAGVFEFAAIDRANAGDFRRQGTRELGGGWIVAAYQNITLYRTIFIEQLR